MKLENSVSTAKENLKAAYFRAGVLGIYPMIVTYGIYMSGAWGRHSRTPGLVALPFGMIGTCVTLPLGLIGALGISAVALPVLGIAKLQDMRTNATLQNANLSSIDTEFLKNSTAQIHATLGSNPQQIKEFKQNPKAENDMVYYSSTRQAPQLEKDNKQNLSEEVISKVSYRNGF